MFKKNTAVTGFGIGNFINATTGAVVTTGTPTETRLIDGTGAALTNAATYNTNAAQWEIDLVAADMNGDVIGLSFALASCLPISYTIHTVLGVPQATIAATNDEMDLINAPNATAITAIQNGLATPTNITAGVITTVTTLTGHTPQTGDSFARIGALGASLTALSTQVSVDNVKAETVLIVEDTGELQTNQGNWLTATGFATPTNITAGTIATITNPVTLANGAHGGAAASLTLADYSDFTGAAAANPNVLQSGTITVTDQTHFTLNAGSADDDAYLNMVVVFEDAATATQKSVRTITDYVGASKTVTIDSAPDFTIVTTDKFDILAVAPGSTPPTVGQIRTEMDDNSTQLAAIVEDTGTTLDTLIKAIPTNAEFEARTVSSTAATNIEDTYDGTGYTENSAPATQEQVGRLTSGTAAINTVAGSFTKSGAEPETNTYTSTFALDGTFHIVEDVANATDAYYEFDVGGNGVPVSITWQGYAQGITDSYTIWAYNYVTPGYEQIGTVTANVGTTVIDETFSLTNAHVGTGASAGLVRFRFLSADGSAFATDRILCSYAVVSESAGYSDGAIWVNTLNSNTNTTDYVDGTSDNPVSTWAAAKTLSASLSIKKFHIVNGSTITLDANSDNFTFVGHEWTLALGGQSIANAHFEDATVSGISTGTGAHFEDCNIGICSLTLCSFSGCHFPGEKVTLLSASIYTAHNSGTGGASAPPTFDFGAAIGNTQIVLNNWSGGVKVMNLNAAGIDKVSVIGNGKLTIDSTCAGGTIGVHGAVTITDNVVGGFESVGTLNDDGRYDIAQINEQCDTALTDYAGPTRAELTTDTNSIITEVDANETKIDLLQVDSTAILLDTGTTIPGTITTMQSDVTDVLTDTGTTIPATITTIDTVVDAIKVKTDNLPDGIIKNTAITAFTFLMVDSTDHVTGKTGLTVAGNYSGDGGAVTALTNTAAITEISNGLYEIDLTAGELNFSNVTLIFTSSGADARIITIHTST